MGKMNKKNFGLLVKSLRESTLDSDLDEPCTQAKLGEVTQLGERVIGSIERGEKVNLDNEILSKLADAFQLTSVERREFFFAGIDNKNTALVEKTTIEQLYLTHVLDVLAKIQVPAFINDVFTDIVATNRLIRRLFGIETDEHINQIQKVLPAGYNATNFVFSEKTRFRKLIGERNWDEIAKSNLLFFRRVSLRYRYTKYFKHLLKNLKKEKLFRYYWELIHFEKQEVLFEFETYNYSHPNLGSINYLIVPSEIVTPYSNLWLHSYLPLNEETAHKFQELAKEGIEIKTHSKWPKDELIINSTMVDKSLQS
jgi:transcriptional regulator with XRE-family HTH domain